MRITAPLLLAAIALGAPAAPASPDQAALFSEATRIARDARTKEELAEAIARYERILATGLRNGYVEYNLGNAYFRTGDAGRALLHWRRAERLLPGDPQIARNIDFARTRALDKFETESAADVLAVVCFWHAWPLETRWHGALLFFTCLWACLALRLRRRVWTLTAGACACGIVACALGVSACVTMRRDALAPPAVITAEQTVVRQGNYEESEPVFTGPVHSGTEVLIIDDTRGPWVRVEFPNKKDGWVRRETVERI